MNKVCIHRGKLFYSEEANRWCLPNMASDRSVVMRSQRSIFELEKRRPVQFNAYFGMSSLSTAIFGIVFGILFYLMASFTFTRSLLLKVGKVFMLRFFLLSLFFFFFFPSNFLFGCFGYINIVSTENKSVCQYLDNKSVIGLHTC